MQTVLEWWRHRSGRELRWIAMTAVGIFLVAVLVSDFFQIASYGGVWQAINDAEIAAPRIGNECGPGLGRPGCNAGWQLAIPIRYLAAAAILISGASLYRAGRVSAAAPSAD